MAQSRRSSFSAAAAGSHVNVVPPPRSDWQRICPACSLTIFLQIANPRPVPPRASRGEQFEQSTFEVGWNSRAVVGELKAERFAFDGAGHAEMTAIGHRLRSVASKIVDETKHRLLIKEGDPVVLGLNGELDAGSGQRPG